MGKYNLQQRTLSSKEVSSDQNPNDDVETERKNTTHLSPSEIAKEKRRIMKNISVIAVAFLLNFTAYMGLEKLQVPR